jgi:hypothetical protein
MLHWPPPGVHPPEPSSAPCWRVRLVPGVFRRAQRGTSLPVEVHRNKGWHGAAWLALLLDARRHTVATCEGVVVEVVQVLESKHLYNFPRAAIHAALTDVIRMRGIRLPHKRTYLRALDLYASTSVDREASATTGS